MPVRPRSSVLDRLRRSARLAALVLLVFAMKIASTTACVTHDYAAAGADDHAAVVQAVDTGEDAASSLLHAAVCTHCGCHQASALPAGLAIVPVAPTRDRVAYRPGPPPRPASRETLRPPIV